MSEFGELTSLLGNALMRVAHEIFHGDVDARGLMTNSRPLSGVDVYMHPETSMWLRRDIRPYQIDIDCVRGGKRKGPPGAFGKFMNCWLIADSEQPTGAFVVRNKGETFEVVIIPSALIDREPEPSP
jgi:hypothetical protein